MKLIHNVGFNFSTDEESNWVNRRKVNANKVDK